MDTGADFEYFTGFCDPISHIELPCSALIQERYLVLLHLDMPCVFDNHGRPGLFCIETEEEQIGGA